MTATPMQSASTSMVHLAANVKQDIMATQNNQDCGLMEETVLVCHSQVQIFEVFNSSTKYGDNIGKNEMRVNFCLLKLLVYSKHVSAFK